MTGLPFRRLRAVCPMVAAAMTCLVAAAGGEPGAARAADKARAADQVAVTVRNLSDRRQSDSPVTFGQVFRKGQFASGVRIESQGRAVSGQIDVKRRHDDGSIRLAVVTAMIEDLAAGQEARLALTPGPPAGQETPGIAPSDWLPADFDATVTFRFPDGAVRTASARKLLDRQGDKATAWLSGPLVREWLVSAPPADQQGRLDEDLSVQFHVRAYRGGKRVRVSVVVENCWDTWAGNIRYDISISMGGREVFSRASVDHRRLSRWRKTFWSGEGEPPLSVAHDLAYLISTGALPNYDRTLPPPGPRDRSRPLPMEGPDWDILGRGPLTAYMPTTGGRPEIVPYPLWTVRYLLSMDPPAKAMVLSAGDLAGSWPIHVRARATGRVMTIDERPEFWLDERGKDRPQWKPDRHAPDPKLVRLSPDLAHQPSLAYVPYLVTGDQYYLQESHFWANYCLLATWPHPRKNARGILADQVRGDAWALRNLGDAAWIANDGDPEAAYFDQKVRNTIADRIGRMYGPPEMNKLGAWGLRTTEDARIQNPANPRWLIIAPWEQDYLIWSFHHLAELGYADAARPRDFLLRLRVGTLTHRADYDPRLAAPYRMVVGERNARGENVVYDDWKTLGRENARLSKPEVADCANCYGYSARAAVVCAVDGGLPGAGDALKQIEAMLPGHRQVMGREPYWAIAPGGVAARRWPEGLGAGLQ